MSLHVEIQGKRLLLKGGRSRWHDGEVWQPLYVHPRTGILRVNPRKWTHRSVVQPKPYLTIDDSHQIRKVNGVWYEVTLAPVPGYGSMIREAVLQKRISVSHETRSELSGLYGSVAYAREKRQLGSREIQRLRKKLEPIEHMV